MAKQPRKPPRKVPPRIQRGGELRPLAEVSLDALVSALGDGEADEGDGASPGAADPLAFEPRGEGGEAEGEPSDGAPATGEAADGAAHDGAGMDGADGEGADAVEAPESAPVAGDEGADEVDAAAPALRPPADDSEADAEVEERRAAAAAAGVQLSDEIPIDPEDDLRDVHGEASPRLVSIVESLLFAAPRPLSVGDLRRFLQETSKQQIQLALKHLMAASAGRGVVVAQVAGGFTMRTHHENATWVQRLLQAKPTRLSRSQLETLAIVAYRQPVTRPEIDAIRGVDSGAVLKVLLERELVQIVGKKDEPGRPLLYGTTLRFLEFFNLRSLRDLPTLRDFRELSEESKATVRSRIGEVHAEALGQGVLGLDLGGAEAVPEDMPGDAGEAEASVGEGAGWTEALDASQPSAPALDLGGEPESEAAASDLGDPRAPESPADADADAIESPGDLADATPAEAEPSAAGRAASEPVDPPTEERAEAERVGGPGPSSEDGDAPADATSGPDPRGPTPDEESVVDEPGASEGPDAPHASGDEDTADAASEDPDDPHASGDGVIADADEDPVDPA